MFDKAQVSTNIRMKIALVLLLAAAVSAAPNTPQTHEVLELDYESFARDTPESRNFLINVLINQLFNFIRNVIANGSPIFGIPPLDPLKLGQIHLVVPAGLINLDLKLQDAAVSGIGGFLVHRSNLDLSKLSFDIEISVPYLNVTAGFRFSAKLFLKQSDNKVSVILDRIDNIDFDIPPN
ncbi:unnamed protein product [Leptidea sinapis]|uniref:Lipid-binding serum glycoprotein N-terminal domain-containing protein n=1 Tax=Leptidea sinapis TaxID=189913 RepID=A0A5E4PS51_9NEOP|nr:unnamed protein product [Leptidea sinapis]